MTKRRSRQSFLMLVLSLGLFMQLQCMIGRAQGAPSVSAGADVDFFGGGGSYGYWQLNGMLYRYKEIRGTLWLPAGYVITPAQANPSAGDIWWYKNEPSPAAPPDILYSRVRDPFGHGGQDSVLGYEDSGAKVNINRATNYTTVYIKEAADHIDFKLAAIAVPDRAGHTWITVTAKGYPLLSSISTSPSKMYAGQTSTGTIRLNTAAPYSLDIAVSSSNNNVAQPDRSSVHFDAGQSTANFTIYTSSTGSAVITASYGIVSTNTAIAAYQPLHDVPNEWLSVQASGLVFNRQHGVFEGILRIKNVHGSSIGPGPFQVLIQNLPPDITLANANGSLEGTPYVTIDVDTLSAGQMVAAPVQFRNPHLVKVSYGVHVVSGVPIP